MTVKFINEIINVNLSRWCRRQIQLDVTMERYSIAPFQQQN